MKTHIDPVNIKKVVVRGTNWVGDAVMTVPALRELRRILPAAHITLFTSAATKGIFIDAGFIDEIMVLIRTIRVFGNWAKLSAVKISIWRSCSRIRSLPPPPQNSARQNFAWVIRMKAEVFC